MARKTSGPKLVDGLPASTLARERLKLILATLSGEKTAAEAAQALGISEARFFEMRAEALKAAAAGLEPRPAGRPPKPIVANDPAVTALEAEVRELKIELAASHVREEIAVAMPHLLKKHVEEGGKKSARKRSAIVTNASDPAAGGAPPGAPLGGLGAPLRRGGQPPTRPGGAPGDPHHGA